MNRFTAYLTASFLVISLWLGGNLLSSRSTTVFAQAVKPKLSCSPPKSKKDRYQCFLNQRKAEFKRVQENIAAQKKREQVKKEAQAQQRENTGQASKQQAKRQQALDLSRQRNVSNKGKAYQITYGRVLEPPLEQP